MFIHSKGRLKHRSHLPIVAPPFQLQTIMTTGSGRSLTPLWGWLV